MSWNTSANAVGYGRVCTSWQHLAYGCCSTVHKGTGAPSGKLWSMTGSSRPVPRMAKDSFRSWITLAVITPLAFILPLTLGAQFTWPVTRPLVLTYLLLFLVTFAVFVALTWITFRGHDPAALAHIVRESTPRSRAEKRHLRFLGGGGASWSVQAALLALAAVLLIALLPDLRADPVVTLSSIGLVITGWITVVVSYGLKYVREDVDRAGLEFPGSSDLVFADYLYLACQISTTFSSSDVQVTTTRMRRLVSGQSVVAFIFSTVILALLVSTLLSYTGG